MLVSWLVSRFCWSKVWVVCWCVLIVILMFIFLVFVRRLLYWVVIRVVFRLFIVWVISLLRNKVGWFFWKFFFFIVIV